MKYTVRTKLKGGKWFKLKFMSLKLALVYIETYSKMNKGNDYHVTLTRGVF